ncbi:MAG: InlB B-repeat-containing protein [Christensenellales bacterium]
MSSATYGATYLTVKVNNVAQTFSFSAGKRTIVGKDYTSLAGLSPSFDMQVTGYGKMIQILPLAGGPWVSTGTRIYSLKVIVTYSALYTVTWKSGEVTLETDVNLPYHTMPSYEGASPTRAADAQYTYAAFTGWEPAVAAVEEDTTYQAVFEKTLNAYTVTWKSAGEVMEVDQGIPYGSMPDYAGTVPERASTDLLVYAFSGWEPAVGAVAGDVSYEALFSSTDRLYTISFDSAGGSEAAPIIQAHGTAVTAPENPAREGYTFIGWNPAVPAAMPVGGFSCVALWQAKQYKIAFDSAGGSPVGTVLVDFDAEIVLPPEPSRAGYTFDAWVPGLPAKMPAGDLACTAAWLRNMYTLRYLPGTQGTFPAQGSYVYYNAVPPALDFDLSCSPGYVFTGWDPALPSRMPAGNSTHTAQWREEGNLGSVPGASEYAITFDSAGGSPVTAIRASAGAPLAPPEPPVRDGYVFAGWSPAVPETMPATDMTCAAQWKPRIIHYPNNTLCIQGLRLRDLSPELTSNWQMFLPVDLSRDGVQRVPLIASNLYYAGEAKVEVVGDSVTVTYEALRGIEVKSEFLALLPNMAAALSTDPLRLQAYQFSFAQPISIGQDLGGDSRVVVYIMNVINYSNQIPGLRLFTDRHPDYQAAMAAVQAIME